MRLIGNCATSIVVSALVLSGLLIVQACRGGPQRGADTPSDAPTATATSHTVTDSTQPADVVRRYYAAVGDRDFASAYALWGQDGEESGQTLRQFTDGFDKTAKVRVTVGDSIRLEGAAGSQYATVPVTVDATLRDGSQQRFAGTYTLRRAMVDGATASQRRWHIYKADLHGR
jgi:hypothetical protein